MSSESIYLRSSGPFLYDMVRKRFVAVRDGFVVGRTTGDLTFPEDNMLSRSHFKLYLSGAGVREAFVEDLRSTNGVIVNGQGVAAGGKVSIGDGAVIEVGDQVFWFTYTQEVPPFDLERTPRKESGAPVIAPTEPPAPVPRQAPVAAQPAKPVPPAAKVATGTATELAAPAPQPAAERSENSQLTSKVLRQNRFRPLSLHPVIFQRTDIADPTPLQVLDVSEAGIGFLRDPGFKWPALGAKLTGRLVGGDQSVNVTVEIQRKMPFVVGCDFYGAGPELKRFIESYFNIELAACQMQRVSETAPAVGGRTEHCFRSEHCELVYVEDGGKLAEWSVSLFGNRIDADAARKLRMSSELMAGSQVEQQVGMILANAMRLVANVEGLNEDVRDTMSAVLASYLAKA